MPFTPSHTAALTLLWPLGRRLHLPFAALAIGAMSPDFEFFLHLSPRSVVSHTFAGLFMFCVPAGLAAFAGWELLAREPVRVLLGMEAGASSAARDLRWWSAAAAGVLLGAASHQLWDGVTHGSYWGADLWPWLRTPAFSIAGAAVPWFNALQHLSTLVGGLVVAGWALLTLRRDGEVSLLWKSAWRRRALWLVCACTLLVAAANGSRGPFGADFWTAQRLLGRIAVGALLGMGLGVSAFALSYRRRKGSEVPA